MRLWEGVIVHQDLQDHQDLRDLQDPKDRNCFKNLEEQLQQLDPQDLQEHLDQLD
ncbi:hypothetical protein [Paenibacillus solani]|uniref:hypothetical protein n=1 Tax=Paenibacillus solani TaxID=1705565 RepID=UPI000AF635A8|nr:hypothetical protein [Paenibacillus solani]